MAFVTTRVDKIRIITIATVATTTRVEERIGRTIAENPYNAKASFPNIFGTRECDYIGWLYSYFLLTQSQSEMKWMFGLDGLGGHPPVGMERKLI